MFKTIVSDINEVLLFLIAPISYEPETLILQLEDLNQELINSAATYKSDVSRPNKAVLLTIGVPLKILTGHLQDHHTHYSISLNINPYLKYEATIKTNRLQQVNNHLDDVVPPPTPGGYLTTTSYSDVCITDKINMHLTNYPPTAVYFPTQTVKQDKPPSLSIFPNLQFVKSVTHVDSNGTWVPSIITQVMVFAISGDPMYLIEDTPNKTC